MKTLMIAIVMLVSTAAFGRTKACTLVMDLAGKELPRVDSFVKDLDNYTDTSRPAVEEALTAYIKAFSVEMNSTCAASTEKEAVAVAQETSNTTTLALVNFADARMKAQRKAGK